MVIAKKKIKAPLYSTLGDVHSIHDATGLRWNTINSYGHVDSAGSVVEWHGISPGVTGTTDLLAGSAGDFAPLHLIDGFVNFGGGARAIHENTTSYNFLHYNATAANLKYTIHVVCKIGNETNPNWVYGILGNNGTSSGNRGIHVRFEDRASIPRSNGLSHNNTSGAAINIQGNENDVITPNVPFVLTLECDNSQAAGSKYRWLIDGVEFAFSDTAPSATLVSGYSIALEIGSTGNGVLPLFGWVSHVIIQMRVETSGVRDAFIQSLIPFTRKKANQYYQIDESRTYNANTWLDESTYYLNANVERNPVTGNILAVFGNWSNAGHLWSETNYVAFRKSTGDVSIWGTKGTAFSPAGTRGIIDCGFFFDASGIGHGFANSRDGTGTTATTDTDQLHYFTTSDDGDNWTSQVITTPADGLMWTAAYGNGYQSDGYYFFPVYRLNDAVTSSAVYVLRWPVGGNIATDLEWKLIQSGTVYQNESTIARIGTNSHILIVRDEDTLEWNQYRTTDNWDNVTDDGAQTFGGESNTGAGPCRMTTFQMSKPDGSNVTDVVACYYPLRGTAELKVIYAKASDLLASGTWDTDTKTLIVNDTEFVHYGGVYQINNGFNFFAIYSRESATALNTLISFRGPSTQHGLVKTQLGI